MSRPGGEYGSQSLSMEMETPRRSESLLQLRAIEGTEYQKDVRVLTDEISDSILEDPTSTKVLGFLGLPSSGKSTLSRLVARKVTREGGRVDNFIKKIGGGVRVDVIAWRDLWKGKHTVPELPPNHPDKREKQAEIDLVNENLSDALVKTISRYSQYADEVLGNDPSERFFVEYGTNASLINIVLFDAPPISGTKTEDGQVGIVRGEDVIRNLSSHAGEFKGLKPYRFWGVGVSASPEVTQYGLTTRAITKSITDPEDQRLALAQRGVFVHGQEHMNMNEYVQEGASPAESDEVKNDMIDTILYLVQKEKILLPPGHTLTRDTLQQNEHLLYQLVSKGLLPWIFRNRLEIFPYHGTILDNNKVHKKIDVPYDLPDEHHPLQELYPEKRKNTSD